MALKKAFERFYWRQRNSLEKRIVNLVRGKPDAFLDQCRGVIHIGANAGYEASQYGDRKLPVVWAEPIPDVFAKLLVNIAPYPEQRAVNALVTDTTGQTYKFNVAGNHGQSSSIYEWGGHKEMYPDVEFVQTLDLQSKTLEQILADEGLEASAYDALVMDTQGSELLVLKGAEPLLANFRFIKTEAADFEAYKGCATLQDITAWLAERGFVLKRTVRNKTRNSLGSYFDAVYERL